MKKRHSQYSNCRVLNLTIEQCERYGHTMEVKYPGTHNKVPSSQEIDCVYVCIIRRSTSGDAIGYIHYRFLKLERGYAYSILERDNWSLIGARELESAIKECLNNE